jgi:hypothetical protein
MMKWRRASFAWAWLVIAAARSHFYNPAAAAAM